MREDDGTPLQRFQETARELLGEATAALTAPPELVCLAVDDTTMAALAGPRFQGRRPRRLTSPHTTEHGLDLAALGEPEALAQELVPALAGVLSTLALDASSGPAFMALIDGEWSDLTTEVVERAAGGDSRLRERYRGVLLARCLVNDDLESARGLLATGASFSEQLPGAEPGVTAWIAALAARDKQLGSLRQGASAGTPRPSVATLCFALTHGAEREARTSRAQTPLLLACSEVDLPWARALLDAGADASARSKRESCLNAVLALPWHPDATELATLLVARGAEVDAPDESRSQRTALHVACEHGLEALTANLIAAGAEVGRADTEGATPLTLALDRGHLGCARLLLRSGAKLPPASAGLEAVLAAHEARDHAGFVTACDAMPGRPVGATAVLAMADTQGLQREALVWADRWLADGDFDPALFAAATRLLPNAGADRTRLRALWRRAWRHLAWGEVRHEGGLPDLAIAYLRAGAAREALVDLGLALERHADDEPLGVACGVVSALLLAHAGCNEAARARLRLLEAEGVELAPHAPSDLVGPLDALRAADDAEESDLDESEAELHYPDEVFATELVERVAEARERAGAPGLAEPSAEIIAQLARDLRACIATMASELPEDETLGAIVFEWGGQSTLPYGASAMASGFSSWRLAQGRPRLGGQCLDAVGDVDLAARLAELGDMPASTETPVAELVRLDIARTLRLAWLEAKRSPEQTRPRLREPLLLVASEHEQEPIVVWSGTW